MGCVWAAKVVSRDTEMPFNNTPLKKKKKIQKPEIICNHLQLLSNSENSFTEVECVCVSV